MAHIRDLMARRDTRRSASMDRLHGALGGLKQAKQFGMQYGQEQERIGQEGQRIDLEGKRVGIAGAAQDTAQQRQDWLEGQAPIERTHEENMKRLGMGLGLSDEEFDRALATISAGRSIEMREGQQLELMPLYYSMVQEALEDGWADEAGNINYAYALNEILQEADYKDVDISKLTDIQKKGMVRTYIYNNFMERLEAVLDTLGVDKIEDRSKLRTYFRSQFGGFEMPEFGGTELDKDQDTGLPEVLEPAFGGLVQPTEEGGIEPSVPYPEAIENIFLAPYKIIEGIKERQKAYHEPATGDITSVNLVEKILSAQSAIRKAAQTMQRTDDKKWGNADTRKTDRAIEAFQNVASKIKPDMSNIKDLVDDVINLIKKWDEYLPGFYGE